MKRSPPLARCRRRRFVMAGLRELVPSDPARGAVPTPPPIGGVDGDLCLAAWWLGVSGPWYWE